MDFIQKVAQWVLEGWNFGHGVFWQIESICGMVGIWIELRFKKHHPAHGFWNKWGDRILKNLGFRAAFGIFIVTSFLWVPYLKVTEGDQSINDKTAIITGQSKKIESLSNELKDSERARLKAVEAIRSSSQSDTNYVAGIIADNEKQMIKDLMSSNPPLAMLSRITAQNPAPIIITNGAPLDLQRLRAEQRDRSVQQKESAAQQEAAQALRTIYASHSNELAYAIFAATAHSFLDVFTNQLTSVAVQGDDHVISTYEKIPEALISNLIDYATIKLAKNPFWSFRVSLYISSNDYEIQVTNTSQTNAPMMNVMYEKNVRLRGSKAVRFYFGTTYPGKDQLFAHVAEDGRSKAITDILRAFLTWQDDMFPLPVK